jgi:hypothetical protein
MAHLALLHALSGIAYWGCFFLVPASLGLMTASGALLIFCPEARSGTRTDSKGLSRCLGLREQKRPGRVRLAVLGRTCARLGDASNSRDPVLDFRPGVCVADKRLALGCRGRADSCQLALYFIAVMMI